jgi:hypothetical protein
MINGIADEHNFKVRIPMPPTSVLRLYIRLEYCESVIDWIDQLVEWDHDAYSVQIAVPYIDVWFKKAEHATMCAIKWA